MRVLVISLALFFDFANGFHENANAMATPGCSRFQPRPSSGH
ncbi:phosphate/sulfate permease [Arthrobacter bambusae]|nr:phosphate/sulfate permease [Arthrobacter bambusae]MDQ0236497.1 phosphate/sulfate permease [Arthrobacter bambusae]